ncbi:MAG: DUF4954 family protein, partial [Chitinophagaceae bacterium]|nr:DUF4954 family protein [Chitinophagaceae bacterium]
MNQIERSPISTLGYNFISPEFIPKGKDEYHLRNIQNKSGIEYRQLTAYEIESLVRNRNTSDDWNKILVGDAFNPELVQSCKFFGLVRIGKLEPYYLEFHNLRRPVGLYNSTIISCDFGDNVVVDNVNYISHYIVGNDVMLVNVNEIAATGHAKFGNGVLKEGEAESRRIWMEVCNENGGRSIIPFDGLLPGDAYLWTRNRDNDRLQERFKKFTDDQFDKQRGYYGTIGDRTVIKNCRIIKDVKIGTDAYLKGANKVKNVTINSSANAKSQIGEGCELVNGIVDYGCRVFYGVKAVRFFLATNSQLKYGARLINSYLGSNSTISCCEVLNSLIFPAHEQHHNNSFLCAALVEGQSNMAAGATIGSNHNSRSPDGEIIAGRGFWPGLCVSLKHNSKFASFCILAKGDYPVEMNITIPFSLVSNDTSRDQLVIMPAYWFMYNMYALARNSWKYGDRDKRTNKLQLMEFDFLAPDTINEILDSIAFFEDAAGKLMLSGQLYAKAPSSTMIRKQGKQALMEGNEIVDHIEITESVFENSSRQIKIVKVAAAYKIFRELVAYYAVDQVLNAFENGSLKTLSELNDLIPARNKPASWSNIGGQLIPGADVDRLLKNIINGKVKSWSDVHEFYRLQSEAYSMTKLIHAAAALREVFDINLNATSIDEIKTLFKNALSTREWMVNGIYESREKDYQNEFRKMVYD